MFFNPRSLLVGAAALFLSGVATAGDCLNGPWDGGLIIGGNGGGDWCATKYDQGIVVTGMEVWASNKAVRAVQLYYSDGTNSGMIGTLDDVKEHQRLDWDPSKDGISQMKSWGNGKGQYLGRVYLRLKSGGELNVGKDTDGQDVFETNVGSGIMLGAWGKSGDVIDSMGVRFLRSKISKVTIENVKFSDNVDDLNSRMQGLNTMIIDYASHKNNQANATVDFSLQKRQTRMVTKTYTQSAATSFGITQAIEVSGELLGIGAKSTTTLSFETTNTDTSSLATADTTDLTYSTSTTVPPGGQVYCRATAMSGVYKGNYDADVKIYLEDGTDFSFAQGGVLDQVTWSMASSECQNDPFTDNMPAAEAPIEIVDLNERRAMKFIA
ncbi:hypothetical protein BU23DRAFT_472961 [Bimuria novae-zelandiae CBS 107.79]|uniref:Jacalin-type lectin domain-containing protein n=1 Tax=Bimuria novae-zelandiae CBS 107.79 TaxID=1447943 RepID=A0A6A5V186_9PLEO|nr:hypothetical protein BU23DRAFT_472961 [Bimuria novae-zelandiae CBS 107.79]